MRKDLTSPDLRSIQNKIVARRFDAALADLSQLLATDPENAEALYMSAVCRRYKGDFQAAIKLLSRLGADA